ncbi:hypothetical protein PG987_000311 [Apiospora arundinis]
MFSVHSLQIIQEQVWWVRKAIKEALDAQGDKRVMLTDRATTKHTKESVREQLERLPRHRGNDDDQVMYSR